MEGITIPNIITTLGGTIIAPTTIIFIIVGIIGGTIGGIGIDRCRAIRHKRCVARQLKASPMETNSVEFKKTSAQTWAEWVEKRKAGERQVCFPAEVIDSLRKLGPASWDLVDAAIEKVSKEDRLEQAIQDLKCLINNEDSFQWPLSDPKYCLALVVFRKFKDEK
jgi:hypothetical protein